MASVAKELFTRRFWMNVEERAFYSDEWIEEVGIMGVNTMEEAEVIMGRYRQVKLTIPMLAEYYSKDYKLQIIDTKDPAIMFDLIDTHLNNWIHITNTLGYVSQIPPIEDFELLDNLAEVLYPYRKVNSALEGIFKLFKGSIGAGAGMKLKDGMYQPASPKLFKYCQQVWGE